MAVSARASFAWHCAGCDQERSAVVWRVVDARERADVLAAPGPGLAWADCPQCGARADIDVPLLVLRPGRPAPLLLGLSLAELRDDPGPSALALLGEAERAGAFDGDTFDGQLIPLPRTLLAVVLTRDPARDLADPATARTEVEPHGQAAADHYALFLRYFAEERADTEVNGLLYALLTSMPDELDALLRTRPELTRDTRVRDAGRAEVRAAEAAGRPDAAALRRRQRFLEDLSDGRTPRNEALRRYLASLSDFGGGLYERLRELCETAFAAEGTTGIAPAREALELAAHLGEEDTRTELSALLGDLLLRALHAGLDAELSEVLGLLEHALTRLPEGSLEWVRTANHLAAAHYLRDDGDRLEVWEAGRGLMARASRIDREEHPEFWALIQTNYGLLLAERPGGGPADLSLGIDRIRAALEERSPARSPVDWAYSLVNLGLLLQRRGEPDDLREAERCHRDALDHLGPDDDRALWMRAQCNLAELLLRRDPPDAHAARTAARAASELSVTGPGPLNTARVTWLSARASDLIEGAGSAESVRLRSAALAAAPPADAPSLHLDIAGELLDIHAGAERWDDAADVASGMLTAVSALHDAQMTVASRRDVVVRVDRIARWTAFLLARAGRCEHAVRAIERGLARELSTTVGRGAADLAELAAVDSFLARRYREAQVRYDASVTGPVAPAPAGLAPAAREQADAERALRAVVEEIRTVPGLEDFLRTTELPDIARAAAGLPLAYLVNAPWGSYVLVVGGPGQGVRAVHVPEVTSVTLLRLLVIDPEDGTAGLWLVQQATRLRRRRELPGTLERLTALAPLVRPLAALLADGPHDAAVVVPTGLLGLVPLHAVPLDPGRDRVLDDIGTLYVAPSAAVHAASRARAARPPAARPHLVAVTDPDGSLPGSRGELGEIRDLFGPRGTFDSAVGAEATVGWVLDHLADATHLHLSCHGGAESDSQGGSLVLADGRLDMDTLVRHRLPHCRVAVAGACQSGHYGIVEAPDEFLGLPAAFLQAGSACAVTSLWQVDDLATAFLMTRFYELLRDGRDPVPALRRARGWLRRLTWEELARCTESHRHLAELAARYAAHAKPPKERPFASPVHWAAFTAWGA
ncbi:CHAT domain-containing protein [Streptomyces sp. NPDC002564]|uniref:CHAT domain-containing protein n=1 Tax=Streptomyces sp. NPDC002564 TaxID=3364649 RepID=UPI0036CF128E